MEESILKLVKEGIGVGVDDTYFDNVIIMHINSVFSVLSQLGAGPEEGFRIKDDSTVWTDYVTDEEDSDLIKSYMCHKVKLFFDPPTMSALLNSLVQIINEEENRIKYKMSNKEKEVIQNGK